MQFHLNGFRTGDPHLHQPAIAEHTDTQPETLDVLIIGAGPAGLTLAAQLATFPDISTRIVEQKSGPLQLGQADGIACRTVEMFEAFGFAERVLKEAYWVNETTFWKPDPERRDHITRADRIQDTEDGLSEFPHLIMNQARVHDFYLDVMQKSPSRLTPDYGRRLLDVSIGGEAVTARLEHDGQLETVKARFVVGCDGARSEVRKSLGRALAGDSANQAWGVMDVLAITDFPDIRLKSAIHSAREGSILIIPREGGYLVRLYIELDKLGESERVASRNIDSAHLIAAARRILHPYRLDVKEVAWWSVYEIGQRLCDKFDDVKVADVAHRMPKIFIVGDACHTHSPKAGQGMNVSMQDAFNLGWKLASVIRGQASPEILHTYSNERQTIAAELIDFDREFAKMFSAPPKDPSDPASVGIDPAEFQKYFIMQGRFTAGTATRYQPSVISAPPAHQHLAAGLVVGMRFHSAPVIRVADAKPMQLGHTVKADGRWRLFAFAPVETAPLMRLCTFLESAANSPIKKYTPVGADIDSIIDVRAILQQPHASLALETMPSLLLPQKGRYGLRDYEKIFCPDFRAGDIFDLRGIDRSQGCMIVVRPDQYIAHILPLEDHAGLAAFFDGFLRRAD
jgi:phenol 2-monooxygenase